MEVITRLYTDYNEFVTTFLDAILRTLPDLDREEVDVLCLGLGSPTESFQARFQLCLLLEMKGSKQQLVRGGHPLD